MNQTATHGLLVVAARTIVPSLLGALGALAATLAPAYYHAVCGSGALPYLGG